MEGLWVICLLKIYFSNPTPNSWCLHSFNKILLQLCLCPAWVYPAVKIREWLKKIIFIREWISSPCTIINSNSSTNSNSRWLEVLTNKNSLKWDLNPWTPEIIIIIDIKAISNKMTCAINLIKAIICTNIIIKISIINNNINNSLIIIIIIIRVKEIIENPAWNL